MTEETIESDDVLWDKIRQKISEALPRAQGLDSLIALDAGATDLMIIDTESQPPQLYPLSRPEAEDLLPDCTIFMKPQVILDLMEGKIHPMWAYSTGRLKIQGNMGTAMKLADLF